MKTLNDITNTIDKFPIFRYVDIKELKAEIV